MRSDGNVVQFGVATKLFKAFFTRETSGKRDLERYDKVMAAAKKRQSGSIGSRNRGLALTTLPADE